MRKGNNLYSTNHNLKENFENIAILRPISGVIWPGALVKGNQSMMDGLPNPITLPLAPVTFSIESQEILTAIYDILLDFNSSA